jgi:diacylglycerol kinase (ATP)
MVERNWADLEGGPGAAASRSALIGQVPRTEATRIPSASSGGWVGIAANAASGRGRGRSAVARLAAELERLGVEARIAWTLEGRKELVDASAEPASGPDRCRCLVAAGGDGTVAALINERPTVPIAVVPAGTENLFARHFGFVRDARRAAERIVEGRSVSLDLGLAGDRRFALMAGFGFDADVVSRHHAARVGQSGLPRTTHRAAYVEPVLRSSFGYRFPLLTIAAEDTDGREETLAGTTAFVFNLPRYALGLPFAPLARGDDGWLDLVVFREPGAFRALHYLWLVVRGLHLDRPGITHRRVRRVTIEAAATVPVQLDGDPGGEVEPGSVEPWTIEVLPLAVEVIAPSFRLGRSGR